MGTCVLIKYNNQIITAVRDRSIDRSNYARRQVVKLSAVAKKWRWRRCLENGAHESTTDSGQHQQVKRFLLRGTDLSDREVCGLGFPFVYIGEQGRFCATAIKDAPTDNNRSDDPWNPVLRLVALFLGTFSRLFQCITTPPPEWNSEWFSTNEAVWRNFDKELMVVPSKQITQLSSSDSTGLWNYYSIQWRRWLLLLSCK